MSENKMLQSALAHARRGWYVFPVQPRVKEPLIKMWQNRATTDEAIIRRWWSQWPNANIGLACGLSGFVVIDLDVKGDADGIEVWNDLTVQHSIDDNTEYPRSR